MKHIIALILVSFFAGRTFAQDAVVTTSNFVDNIKCIILGLDYKHFLYLSVSADKNSYTVGETSNQNGNNTYKNYTQVQSNVEASSASTTQYVRTLTGEGVEFVVITVSNWSLKGSNFNFEGTIATDVEPPYSYGRGNVTFNSKLNPAINSTKSYPVSCYYKN